jgi:phosphopantothenoylcysteine decarboxylase/phosphopantothenate--cysteine ligase
MAPSRDTPQSPDDQAMKRVALAVTGSIGIVSVPPFILWMRQELGVDVRVIMSEAATRFVSPMTLKAISGHDVVCSLFPEAEQQMAVPHVQTVMDASLLLVLPATANVIAKSAAGIADDIVTTSLLAARCPIVFVPAMSQTMWTNRLVQRNVAVLREIGYTVMEPASGVEVATMKQEVGSLPAFAEIARLVRRFIHDRSACCHRVQE